MIETDVLVTDPVVIRHKVSDFSDDNETAGCVDAAVQCIEQAARNSPVVHLLLDFTDPMYEKGYRRSAHKLWATGFKNNEAVTRCISKTAVVGPDSPQFSAEKELMEDDRHKWFTDYDAAMTWLKNDA